jgi:hypothetical protein
MFRPPAVAIWSASSVHGHESFKIPFSLVINRRPSLYFWRNLIIVYVFYVPLKAQFVRNFQFNSWVEV